MSLLLKGAISRRGAKKKPKLYEYYNTGEDGTCSIYGDIRRCQTFTPKKKHTITLVKLLLSRGVLPVGYLTVGIRTTSEGKPVGPDLCVGTIGGDTLPEWPEKEWREISLGAGAVLEAEVQYAIVCKALECIGDENVILWWYDSSEPTYTGGTFVWSADAGGSWTVEVVCDCMFEEWGV